MATKRISKPTTGKASVEAAAPKAKRTGPVSSHTPRTPATAKALAAEVAAATAAAAPPKPAPPANLHEEIEQLAYNLWVEGGYRQGTEQEDYFRAEKVIKERYGL